MFNLSVITKTSQLLITTNHNKNSTLILLDSMKAHTDHLLSVFLYIIIDFNTVRQRSSNLSAYGSTSLSLNQKDIYNKQNSNFNIITMKPK